MAVRGRLAKRELRAGLCSLALAGALTGTVQAREPAVTAEPGRPVLSLGDLDLGALGYTREEFFFGGAATAYRLAGPAPADGRWKAIPDGSASYRTRMVVVRPKTAAAFNGTVVVEWLNVSAGGDGAADWLMAHRELVRSGYAWIGVSAQKVGVEGGVSMGDQAPLIKADPARYASLHHPGDAYSFDIFSQAARVARNRGPVKVLGPLAPQRLIAAGESQSAEFLTTYVDAVAPLAKAFDGYLIHSRFADAVSLTGGPVFNPPPGSILHNVKLRTDLSAPVLTVLTESDVVGNPDDGGYWSARQADTAKLRTWEIAGAAHADTYVLQVGAIDAPSTPLARIAAAYKPNPAFFGDRLAKPVNSALQHHYVVEAAFAVLDHWIRTGNAPPSASPLELTPKTPPSLVQDAQGLARGGVRTPWMDAPTERLSGVGNSGLGEVGALFGVTEAFDQATLDRLYPGGKREYLQQFEASLDQTIRAGFLLAADRQEILALADLMYPGNH